eukprot:399980-Prorocentrum_minimum.AAC.1
MAMLGSELHCKAHEKCKRGSRGGREGWRGDLSIKSRCLDAEGVWRGIEGVWRGIEGVWRGMEGFREQRWRSSKIVMLGSEWHCKAQAEVWRGSRGGRKGCKGGLERSRGGLKG